MSERPDPGWYADPTRRFEHRYWDGEVWTEHVSRNGQASTDPVDPAVEAWQLQAGAPSRTNVKAIASLVLSLVWLFGLASIAAIVVGVVARREIRQRPEEVGRGMALAGIVIGIVGVLGMLFGLAFMSFFLFGSGGFVG